MTQKIRQQTTQTPNTQSNTTGWNGSQYRKVSKLTINQTWCLTKFLSIYPYSQRMPSPGSEQILKWLFFCNLFLVSLRHALSNGDQQKPKEDSFIIAGYLPEYRFYININNTVASLTDLILFSLAPDNHGKLSSCCLESQHFEQARQARAYRKEQFPGKLWLMLISLVHINILQTGCMWINSGLRVLFLIPSSITTRLHLIIREGAIETMDVYWWSWAKQLL